MQKIIERYELRIGEIQTQFDALAVSNTNERDQCLRLNDELANLTELHQNEMSLMKTDLKNLEDRLLYKFNDYWNELLEKLDKLDTRVGLVGSLIFDPSETCVRHLEIRAHGSLHSMSVLILVQTLFTRTSYQRERRKKRSIHPSFARIARRRRLSSLPSAPPCLTTCSVPASSDPILLLFSIDDV